jgi:Flp pilus assembly pilin Flp
MGPIRRIIRRLPTSRAQTMTEYALILATIAAVCFSLIGTAGSVVKTLVNQVGPLL